MRRKIHILIHLASAGLIACLVFLGENPVGMKSHVENFRNNQQQVLRVEETNLLEASSVRDRPVPPQHAGGNSLEQILLQYGHAPEIALNFEGIAKMAMEMQQMEFRIRQFSEIDLERYKRVLGAIENIGEQLGLSARFGHTDEFKTTPEEMRQILAEAELSRFTEAERLAISKLIVLQEERLRLDEQYPVIPEVVATHIVVTGLSGEEAEVVKSSVVELSRLTYEWNKCRETDPVQAQLLADRYREAAVKARGYVDQFDPFVTDFGIWLTEGAKERRSSFIPAEVGGVAEADADEK